MSNKTIYNNRLVPLHESGFEMVDGEPDIRNWSVVASENQLVGRVSELIFDNVSHRVVYLVVDINGKPLNLISRSVIVPMSLAEIDRKENLVIIPALTVGHLASIPTYEKGKITTDTENTIRSVFVRTPGIVYAGQELAYRPNVSEPEYIDDGRSVRTDNLKDRRISTKEEIRENIIRVKETVKRMEKDLENLD
ncbi:MAG TPA: PRC-barrel domain-containing protein [Puia sp.]|nr:PRC-barrel domain-containing protein [Puia sp.]